MRAYKFLDAHFGLKSLYEKRLKQSRIHELNDPFELTPYVLTDPNLRQAFLTTRDDISNNRGVLCFSAAWRDPVIWAHYSDKHRGLCLGFEIPEIKGDPGNDESMHVSYISEPLQFPPNFSDLPEQERLVIVQKILVTRVPQRRVPLIVQSAARTCGRKPSQRKNAPSSARSADVPSAGLAERETPAARHDCWIAFTDNHQRGTIQLSLLLWTATLQGHLRRHCSLPRQGSSGAVDSVPKPLCPER
jgi:hypothetical protein